MTESPDTLAIDEFSHRRKVGILLICSMSLLIVGLDITIVNVALPSIGRELHARVSGLQWVIDGYTLVLASLLMLSGSMADRVGRRRAFVIGLLTFAAGSLMCSLAHAIWLLVVFRMVQGIGGSMLNPVAMSIITNTFTEPRERAQAIGVWGAVVGISMALGPVIGGLLVSSAGWRSVFWINVPVGLAAAALTLRFVPESRAPHPRRLDPVGQGLVIVVLATLTYAIIEGPGHGWAAPLTIGAFALSAAGAAALILWELRREQPLVQVRFFKSAPFASATVTAIAAFAALGGFLFLNTLYLQDVRGLSALRAGLDTLPMAVLTMVISPISGRIVGRRGSRIPLVMAGVALVASCLMLSRIGGTTPFTWLFGAYVLFGAGFGFVNAPITNAAVSGMPRAQAGVAAAIASTSRQIGQTLGVAVVGALVTTSFERAGAAGFIQASRSAWWTLAGCGAVVLVLAFVATSRRAIESSRRTAALLNPEALGEGQTAGARAEAPSRAATARGAASA